VAGEVRLFEHPDFEQAMLRAAEHYGLSEQFIEKDYYITEILRIVVGELGEKVVFKGGTSLSKGWGLITRFSEDVDLFVNPVLFDPPPGKSKINKILKNLTETVAEYPPLDWRRDEGETIKGLGRNDVLAYESRFRGLPGLRSAIRLEPGIQSGSFPTSEEPISSLLRCTARSNGC
jgi:hypothetical protein